MTRTTTTASEQKLSAMMTNLSYPFSAGDRKWERK